MSKFNISYNFNDLNVLITGGATGIGYAIAELFAESKANLILVDKNSNINNIAKKLENDFHIKALGIEADLTNQSSILNIKKISLDNFSKVDVLVNNAGIVALDNAEKLTASDWNNTLAINLSAAFFLSQAFVQEMIQRKKGKILNIASQAGVIALEKHIAYCVSKAGIISMTKVMALEWGKYNINVNSVSPTVVLTDLGKKAWSGEIGENMKKQIPIRRFALPEEIAATILFLASNASDMIHGENILIDGGFSIQ